MEERRGNKKTEYEKIKNENGREEKVRKLSKRMKKNWRRESKKIEEKINQENGREERRESQKIEQEKKIEKGKWRKQENAVKIEEN